MAHVRAAGIGEVFGAVFLSDTFKLVYVDNTYTFSSAHDRLNDVGAGTRLFTVTLAGKDTTGGVLTAADPANQTPAAGKTIQGAWLYRDSGVESTSELLVWYTLSSAGAPIEGDAVINPTSGDALVLTLPGAPFGLLKL